jgi:hypothetical protein
MTERRPLIDMPERCAKLPLDARGFPVPRFVKWINDQPDFRVLNEQHMLKAVKHKVCWICGEPLGRFLAFPIGPMCAVNRVTSEPPCHRECAIFAIKNCPFLSNPISKRNERDLPDERGGPGGIMLSHNPGGVCLWITKSYRILTIDNPGMEGVLFNLGDPDQVTWWVSGRPATRDEVTAMLDRGFPKLLEACQFDDDPVASEHACRKARANVERYLPWVPA